MSGQAITPLLLTTREQHAGPAILQQPRRAVFVMPVQLDMEAQVPLQVQGRWIAMDVLPVLKASISLLSPLRRLV
jgi:hypothetical protein